MTGVKRKLFALERSLITNICRFVRLLRANSLNIGSHEAKASLEALKLCGLKDKQEFYLVLKTCMAKDPKEIAVFDRLFEQFWFVWDEVKRIASDKEVNKPVTTINNKKKSAVHQMMDMMNKSQKNTELVETASFSPEAGYKGGDFKFASDEDYPFILAALYRLKRNIKAGKSRRYKAVRHSNHLDNRKLFRTVGLFDNYSRFPYRERKVSKNRFVFLLDVSKSMEIYANFLLLFLFVFRKLFTRSHTLVFSSSLFYLHQDIRSANMEDFSSKVMEVFPEWASGTKIGEVLESFNEYYLNRITNSKTTVIILSDGMDELEGEKIAENMSFIRSRVSKIIWLNPLMGYENYRPDTAGMKAALPYIDMLGSAHNVSSLEKTFTALFR